MNDYENLSVNELRARISQARSAPDAAAKPKRSFFSLFKKKPADKRTWITVFDMKDNGSFAPFYSVLNPNNTTIINGREVQVDPRSLVGYRDGHLSRIALCYQEAKQRAVSNMDIDEINQRGDLTNGDAFLIEQLMGAKYVGEVNLEKKNKMGWGVAAVVGIVIGAFLTYAVTHAAG